jgi:hypothetical protein
MCWNPFPRRQSRIKKYNGKNVKNKIGTVVGGEREHSRASL